MRTRIADGSKIIQIERVGTNYELRLIAAGVYLTPKLAVTYWELEDLDRGRPLQLGDVIIERPILNYELSWMEMPWLVVREYEWCRALMAVLDNEVDLWPMIERYEIGKKPLRRIHP